MILKLNILKEFLRGYDNMLTASYISRRYSLNQKTVSNYLNDLEKQNIMRSVMQGKNKLFYFNIDDPEIARHFIISCEHARTLEFLKKNPKVKHIASDLRKYAKGMLIIFGSYAKEEQKKDSDLDIFMTGRIYTKKIEEYSDISPIALDIKRYERFRWDPLTSNIASDHIIIKGADSFVTQRFDKMVLGDRPWSSLV